MVNKNSCIDCINSNCFIKLCSPSWIQRIKSEKRETKYKRGQQIIFEGIAVERIYFIYSGKVKVFKSGYLGKQQIVKFSKCGNILGHRGINSSISPIAAIALEDSVICSYPLNLFLDILQNNPDLTFSLLMFFADELYNSEVRERNMAHMNVREKIADTLRYLKKVYGIDEQRKINICLCRQDIANFAGTTKGQVSKILSDFKREGVIDTDLKSIVLLDESKLDREAFLNSEASYK